jgi:hypothetical protein
MNERVCICIAGWHFPEEFFRALAIVRDADLYLVSHQPCSKIPDYVFSTIPAGNLFIEPNFGYDWGCYQQFLEKGIWVKYTHIVFMHDDVIIMRPDFIPDGLNRLKCHSVVGNHRPAPPTNWPGSHPESYFHASWRPLQRSFVHEVVRGSFFMTTTESLIKLECFEVFWDRWHSAIYFGNWSLRASCAKWQDRCGINCFDYFTNNLLESDYIRELYRGGESNAIANPQTRLQELKSLLTYKLARYYMTKNWEGHRDGIILRTLALGLQRAASHP